MNEVIDAMFEKKVSSLATRPARHTATAYAWGGIIDYIKYILKHVSHGFTAWSYIFSVSQFGTIGQFLQKNVH